MAASTDLTTLAKIKTYLGISQDDNEYQHRVVKLISKSNVITEIEPGEIKEVNFPVYQKTDQNPESIIFFITSDDEVRVYQTLKVDLQ